MCYEFDNHQFLKIIDVQKYINVVIKRTKAMSEINRTNLFFPFFLSIVKWNRLEMKEKNIYYFYFIDATYLYVKDYKGFSTLLSYDYPTFKFKSLN